jgi:hypothetical protein
MVTNAAGAAENARPACCLRAKCALPEKKSQHVEPTLSFVERSRRIIIAKKTSKGEAI